MHPARRESTHSTHMPITRAQKEAQVATLVAQFGKLEAAVLTDYHGLSVEELQDLRAKLREQGMDYQVAKNSLFKRAVEQAGFKIQTLKGPTGVAFGYDDPVKTAKVVNQFTKDHQALEIIGGIVDREIVDVSVVTRLANMPSREELLGRLVGSLSGPTHNLAVALSGVSRNLVYALRAVQEQKG